MKPDLLISAGLAAALTASALAQPDTPRLSIAGTTTPHGFIYMNATTGERLVLREMPGTPANRRGANAWTWNNTVLDGCAPDPDEFQLARVYSRIHDASLAGAEPPRPDAITYWHDWFEHPGDTVISALTFGYFTQLLDPGEDGVEGAEFIMAFTENDSHLAPENAIAHTPIVIGNLAGAEDDGAFGSAIAGDGVIDFAEGNLWLFFVDLATCESDAIGYQRTDIELGDTNGVSDSRLGALGTFSGIPGTDTDGDGLINSGFVVGLRQPGVAEGDGLIIRFPELAGQGLENPDGYDPATFANIRPMGTALVGPASGPDSYDGPSGATWPFNAGYTPSLGEGVGAVNRFSEIDAIGNESGPLSFGTYACNPFASSTPYSNNPWTGWYISLGVNNVGDGSGSVSCDRALPHGVLDLADITAFVIAFQTGDILADFAPPACVLDLADLTGFIECFLAGAP